MAHWNFAGIYSLWHVESGKVYVGQSQNIAKRIREHRCCAGQRRDHYLYRAVEKYGWDAFEWVVMERVDDLALLNEREQYWIDTLHACNPQQGYNLSPTAGSCRGYKPSAAARANMTAAQLCKQPPSAAARANMSAAAKGQAKSPEAIAHYVAARRAGKGWGHTAESIAKISAAKKGIKQSAEIIAKRAAANTGKKRGPHSPETRARLSAANLGKKQSAETRAKMSEAQKNRRLRERMQEDLLKGE